MVSTSNRKKRHSKQSFFRDKHNLADTTHRILYSKRRPFTSLEAFYIQERIPFFGRITLSQPSLKIHSFGVLEDKQIPPKNLQRH